MGKSIKDRFNEDMIFLKSRYLVSYDSSIEAKDKVRLTISKKFNYDEYGFLHLIHTAVLNVGTSKVEYSFKDCGNFIEVIIYKSHSSKNLTR